VFYAQLERLFRAAEHNDEQVIEQLQQIVPTFHPTRGALHK
jgi:hypothetical protein